MNKIICCKANDSYTIDIQLRAWFRVTNLALSLAATV